MKTYAAIEIRGQAPTSPLDLVSAELDGRGVTAVEDIPSGLRAFFVTAHDRDLALAHLRLLPDVICHPIDVPDEDWAARSQAALQPITVNDITVAPPWSVTDDVRARSKHLIVIQPSMGFGTGHHASTRLCLEWLQRTDLAGAAMLDVGTGSGVLAIAALKLGAVSVVGIDVDPDALTSARENGDLNDQGRVILWRELDLSAARPALGRSFNVICANLTGGLLVRDAATFGTLALPGAQLIASGFQSHEAAYVIEAFRAAGWRLDGHIEEDDWVGARLHTGQNDPGRSDRSAV